MARRGAGYGSEDHFLTYRAAHPATLDRYIQTAMGTSAPIEWLYPGAMQGEPKDFTFIPFTPHQAEDWYGFWPRRGNRSWDGVARCGGEWLLFEAKANGGELCSPGTAATEKSLAQILAAFRRTKKYLGVPEQVDWHRRYYQYANRLAALYFLNVAARIPSRLFFLYFTGDCFPDGRPCPASETEWRPLIKECHRQLSLAEQHALSDRVHELFVPALRRASAPG